MKKVIVGCGIVYLGCILAAFDWQTSLFLIPFFVGIVWIIYNAFVYHAQMEEFAEQVVEEQEFTVVEKDELQYVVVKSRGD